MNAWLFIGLAVFGWATRPYPDSRLTTKGTTYLETILLIVAAAMIASVLS